MALALEEEGWWWRSGTRTLLRDGLGAVLRDVAPLQAPLSTDGRCPVTPPSQGLEEGVQIAMGAEPSPPLHYLGAVGKGWPGVLSVSSARR